MNGLLVSIIIPVYNTYAYLDKMFECLLAQTYKNWEAICINDGSSDDSLAKLQEYAAKDSRIFAIDNRHSGVSETRNLGITKAKGKFVFFLDSDDLFESTLVEDCVTYATTNNLSTIIYGYSGINKRGGYTEPHKFKFEKDIYRDNEVI